jgi:nucleoside-diphosphate-sugar epimerase
MRTRVLITGANGFVGSHLGRTLLVKGYEVIGLDQVPPGPRNDDYKQSIVWVVDNLQKVELLTEILTYHNPGAIIHAAAFGVQVGESAWSLNFEANVVSSLNVVEAAAKARIPRVVHLGTSQEYGSQEGALSEDSSLVPQTPYGATKAAAFYLCRQRAKELGVHWVALRPFLSFGPGEQKDKLIPSLIIPLLKGNVPTMTGGEQIRDIVYVKDLIQGITKAIEADLPSGIVINLGSGRGYMLREIAEQILKLFPGGKIDIGGRPYREPEVWHQIADVTFQRKILPWKPSTQLSDALRETVDWYRQNSLSS